MARSTRLLPFLLAPVLLLGGASQAQIQPYEIPTQVAPLTDPFGTYPSLRAAREWNRGLTRSECVWRRVSISAPAETDVEKVVHAERLKIEHGDLSPERRKDHLRVVRELAEREANGFTTSSTFRLQWDGMRTRCETEPAEPDAWMPSSDYYDEELSLFVEGLQKSAPHDFATVQRSGESSYNHVDSTEGMAALLKGVPLPVALRGAQFAAVGSDDSVTVIQMRRQKTVSTGSGNGVPWETVDRGNVLLRVNNGTGRIERIAELRVGDKGVNVSIVPSGYRAYPGGFQLPGRIMVTRYGNGRVLCTEEYTLLSAKFNSDLDPGFLSGPLFSRRAHVNDFRLGTPGIDYTTADRPVTRQKLYFLQFRKKSEEYLPLALLLQIPLITVIIRRRRGQFSRK